MKKRRLSLILSTVLLFLPFNVNSKTDILPKKFKEFKNYRKKAINKYSEEKLFNCIVEYHLRFDYYMTKKGTVLEIMRPSKYKHPLIYGFDKNNNKHFEREELIREPLGEVDGLNGNEIPLSQWEYGLKEYIINKKVTPNK